VPARQEQQLGVRQQPHHAPAERMVLAISIAHEHGRRHRQLAEPAPQRAHLAGAHPAQRRRERLGAVAALILPHQLAHVRRIAGEQRLRAPALDELLEGSAPELLHERPVGAPALGALGLVLDAGAARDQHQRRHPLRRRERDVQRDAPAQRVAAQDEPPGRLGEHAGHTAGECDRARGGLAAVPGQIERQRPVAFRVKPRRHAVPRAVRAAKSVQQDDRLPHSAIVFA